MNNRERLAGVLGRAAGALGIAPLPMALAGRQSEEQPERPQTQAFTAPQPFAAERVIEAPRPIANGKFASMHEVWIVVGPRWVESHFERAKSLCAQDATLRCVLLDASTNLNDAGPSLPSAHLQVRLPHESVDRFASIVTAAVEGEKQTDLVVIRRSTRLEDLGRPLADTKRRLQLEDYRDRLKALQARADTRVGHLIKIANELSQTQSWIEEIDEQRRRMEERVDTELVDLVIQSKTPAGGPLAPIEQVWRRSANIIGASAADALRFVLMITPWTPIVILAFGLSRWAGRAWRRRRAQND